MEFLPVEKDVSDGRRIQISCAIIAAWVGAVSESWLVQRPAQRLSPTTACSSWILSGPHSTAIPASKKNRRLQSAERGLGLV